jgi:oxaloacetate decarboxylase alpha subunit/pyruvate carboxylase subunit B
MEKTGQKPLDCRPADLLKPRMDDLRADLAAKGLPTDDEACVLHAMFPVEFAALHKKPAAAPASKPAAAATPAPATPAAHVQPQAVAVSSKHLDLSMTVDGTNKMVSVELLD